MDKKLIKAVKMQLGGEKEAKETFQDVVDYGASSGVPGFTYYSDTVAFYKRNKKEIAALAEEMAQELGEDVLNMVSNFNCIKGDFTASEIGKVLYGSESKDNDSYTFIANALAWFALETACFEIGRK